MNVLIIANGEFAPGESYPHPKIPFDMVIAVDGGHQHCQALGVEADILMGDLDSLAPALIEKLKQGGTQLITFPPEKDEIDLELALLHAVEIGATDIVVLAGLGGRVDMSLANLSLLAHPQLNDVAIQFWHDEQKIYRIQPPGIEIKGKLGDTLSLLPLGGDATGVRTMNLAYPLKDERLIFGLARGVSNVFTADMATIDLEHGILLAIWTRGRA